MARIIVTINVVLDVDGYDEGYTPHDNYELVVDAVMELVASTNPRDVLAITDYERHDNE